MSSSVGDMSCTLRVTGGRPEGVHTLLDRTRPHKPPVPLLPGWTSLTLHSPGCRGGPSYSHQTSGTQAMNPVVTRLVRDTRYTNKWNDCLRLAPDRRAAEAVLAGWYCCVASSQRKALPWQLSEQH